MNATNDQMIGRPQDLVMEHYSMVQSLARNIHSRLPRHVELDDLVSAGTLGLYDAIDGFDPDRGVPFAAYARLRVRGAIMDSLRASDWVPRSVRRKHDQIERARRAVAQRMGRSPTRVEVADAMGLASNEFDTLEEGAEIRRLHSLDAPMSHESEVPLIDQTPSDLDVLSDLLDSELREQIYKAIQVLPARERTAVHGYYLEGKQLKEVGAELGVTESRACQLRSQGVSRLSYRMRKLVAA